MYLNTNEYNELNRLRKAKFIHKTNEILSKSKCVDINDKVDGLLNAK